MRKRVYIVIFALLIIIMLLAIDAINGHKIINNLYSTITGQAIGESNKTQLSYIVYDNQDPNNVKVLVTIGSESAIEYLQDPNGNIINGNGKNKISIDYISELNKEEIFKVKVKNATEVNEKMTIKQEEIDEQFTITETSDESNQKTLLEENDRFELAPYELYYKIGNDDASNINNWKKYNDHIVLDMSKILGKDNTENSDNIIVNIKRVDKAGNIVYASKICQVHVSTTTYIFNQGEQYEEITGGWARTGYHVSGGTVTIKDNYIYLWGQVNSCRPWVGIRKKIDFSNYSGMIITYSGGGFYVFSNTSYFNDGYATEKNRTIPNSNNGKLIVTLDNIGKKYLHFTHCYGDRCIKSVWTICLFS